MLIIQNGGDQKVDDFGLNLLDLFIQNNLFLLNEPSHGPTFISGDNASFIDLSLCTPQIK